MLCSMAQRTMEHRSTLQPSLSALSRLISRRVITQTGMGMVTRTLILTATATATATPMTELILPICL